MENSIKLLPIDQDLSQKLIYMLNEFDSYRIGKEVVRESKKEVIKEAVKQTITSVEEVLEPVKEKKKRSLSFLERLFITEYAAG